MRPVKTAAPALFLYFAVLADISLLPAVAACCPHTIEESVMLGTILLIVLVLAVVGALPTWRYSNNWGYAPSGGLGAILLVLIVLMLIGRV